MARSMVSQFARTLCAVSLVVAFAATAAAESKPITDEQAEEYKLDQEFFKKGTFTEGVLIATSDKVSAVTHAEAAYQFETIMGHVREDVADRIRERGVLCIIIGADELTSDIPQFASDKTGEELDFYNWRNRGFLTHSGGRPTVVFAEEDVMEYEGGMQIESILIHEFAHVIHGVGFDEALQKKLTETFEKGKEAGLWNDGYAAQRFRRVKGDQPVSLLDALAKSFPDESREMLAEYLKGGDILVNGEPTTGDVKVTEADKVRIVFGGEKQCYAGKNRAEYWAEGVQSWYDTNRTMDHDHNHIHTREQLKEYDEELSALVEEVLGDPEWRFVSPRERAGEGHLEGYDPETAPVIVDPPHIKKAANDYYDDYWKDYWKRLHEKHAIEQVVAETSFETRPSSDENFEIVDVCGWDFHVHKDYLYGDQEVLKNALENAEIQLRNVETNVPAEAVKKLKEIPIWLNPGKRCAEYHWARKWLIDNGRNPDMAHAVQITDICVLEKTIPQGPWVLMHELMHGYHDRYVGKEDKKAITAAYKQALEDGLYGEVLHSKRTDKTHIQAYAGTRMEEYFAETCEAYFGCNDYYPFVRAELKEYDPELCEIIKRIF